MPRKNSVLVKNQRVLIENQDNAEGCKHLFSIARRAGKVDDFATDLVTHSFHWFFS